MCSSDLVPPTAPTPSSLRALRLEMSGVCQDSGNGVIKERKVIDERPTDATDTCSQLDCQRNGLILGSLEGF